MDKDDEGYLGYATLCLECDAMFFQGEEGWDCDECFECGGWTMEVPA